MKLTYTIVIYNESNEVVAALNDVAKPSYNRSKNSADEVSIEIPRKSDKIGEVKIGRRFEILRYIGGDSVVEESGYISEIGYSGDWYTMNGFTEETLLSRYQTPVNYGYPFYSEKANLAEFFDNFARGFEMVQVKGQWGDFDVSSTNIDFTFDEYLLLTESSDVYATDGEVVFEFTKPSNQIWDRFRWVSDYDDESQVFTTVQYRVGATSGTLGPWSAETVGALVDVVGIVIAASSTDNVLQVRVNFDTNNTAVTPRLFALEVIKRTAPILNVDYTTFASEDATAITAPAVEADSKTFLDLAIDACAVVGWEFKVLDSTLYFSNNFGVNRTNDFVLVES